MRLRVVFAVLLAGLSACGTSERGESEAHVMEAADAGPVEETMGRNIGWGVDVPPDQGEPDGAVPPTPADAGANDAGSDAGPGLPDTGDDPAAPSCVGPPGLYKDTHCRELHDDVLPYHPQYPLWSDGASKDRYIFLPAGSHIDTTNPDRWNFPVGTRVYKTFAQGALKIETRILEKISAEPSYNSWTAVTYAWSQDQLSVTLADMNGVSNALGTQLDIPAQLHCQLCHSMNATDAVIGFGAIQLNHHEDGITLADLIAQGVLVNGTPDAPANVSVESAVIPGDEVTKAALGYLHGNCGHCHGGPTPRVNQRLWSVVDETLTDAPIFQTAVCQCLVGWTGRSNDEGQTYDLRVLPSHAQQSGIVGRMSSRLTGEQMPPVGTKMVDPTGLAAVKAWIDSLPATSCDAAAISCMANAAP